MKSKTLSTIQVGYNNYSSERTFYLLLIVLFNCLPFYIHLNIIPNYDMHWHDSGITERGGIVSEREKKSERWRENERERKEIYLI